MSNFWEIYTKCKFCKTVNTVNEDNVQYGDLRQFGFFTPDNQYYIDCTNCNEHLIIAEIPASKAVEIQNRIHNATTT